MQVVSITELSDIIHFHRTKKFEIEFSGACNGKISGESFGATVTPIFAAGSFNLSPARFELDIWDRTKVKTLSFDLPTGRTSVAVYKCLVTYFSHYFRTLPNAFIIKEKLLDDTNSVALNATLLSLIIFMQRSKAYYALGSEIHKTGNWFEEVKRDFDDIPSDMFQEAGIKRCRHNLDEMLRFEVTEDMMNCEAEGLGQFRAPFYPKEV